jgi:hypothetical protein
MPLGEEGGFGKLLETSCQEIGVLRFIFFASLFASDSFRFHFFAVWNISLACEQSEKKPFFSLQSENENPHIFAYFRFKRI